MYGVTMRHEEVIQFNEWAFGPDFLDLPGPSKVKAWNETHAEKSGLELDVDGNVQEDLVIMGTIWNYYKDKGRYPCQKD